MNSWDRFLLPMPFSRGLFVYGEPIVVPPGSSAAEMEQARLALERALDEVTRRADREA